MKTAIIVPILILVMTTALPVWAVEAHHPQSSGQSVTEMTKDQIDSCIKTMETSRMKMVNSANPKEQNTLMHQHMQQMQEGMKMMDMMGSEGMMGSQNDHRKQMMEEKMQMMMEMMRGMMSQQEMMMKNNN